MKFPRVSLVAAMGFAVFLVPIALVLAQTQQGIAPSGGLVPCGATSGIQNWFEATACGFCDLGRLIQNIINFVIGLAIPIAALLFAWAGVLYFTAGGDTGKHTQALSIFKHTFLGFVLALTGWLIVQTILFSVFKGTYYEGWNKIQCVENKSRIRDKDVSDLLKPLSRVQVVPTPPSFSYGVSPSYLDSSSGCVQGDVFQDGRCFDPNGTGETYDPSAFKPLQTGVGNCSPDSLSDAWGTQSSAFSCIASRESSCNPGLGSGVDRTADGSSFSFGLYQVNMSVRDIQCSNFNNGAPVPCQSAFSGKNYKAVVVNPDLYGTCKTMLQNTQCNTEMAQKIYQKEGYGAWKNTATQCGLL